MQVHNLLSKAIHFKKVVQVTYHCIWTLAAVDRLIYEVINAFGKPSQQIPKMAHFQAVKNTLVIVALHCLDNEFVVRSQMSSAQQSPANLLALAAVLQNHDVERTPCSPPPAVYKTVALRRLDSDLPLALVPAQFFLHG